MRAKWLSVALLAACSGSVAVSKPPVAVPTLPAPVPDVAALVALAKDGPGLAQFPQADALVAVDEDEITYRSDGRTVSRHHSVVKVLDAQRGKAKYADVHIDYDSKREQLTLVMARTVNPDGSVHVASKDEISDILPPQLVGAATYAGVLERVVSFPAVDRGSVVELTYERVTEATPDAALGGEALLAAWDPVVLRRVTLTAPIGQPPHYAVEGTTLPPVETEDPAARTHSWTFTVRDLPDRHQEDESAAEAAYTPRLVYGFLPDWRAVEARVGARYQQAAVPAVLPAAIKDKAASIVAGAGSTAETARRLFAFVAHDIHSVDLPLGWAGYQPSPPEEVLARRYGDPRDKVALLLALCAARHIAGNAVLTRAWGVPIVASVPGVAQFDQIVARLSIGGDEVWLDPADEHGQFGVTVQGEGNLVLPLAADTPDLVRRPALDPRASVAHVAQTYVLRDSGDLDVRNAYDFSGSFARDASTALLPLKGDNLQQYFQRTAARASPSAVDLGHEVSDLHAVAGPIAISHHIAIPAYAQAQGPFRVFQLLPPSLDFVDVPSATLSHRKYPLWIGNPRTLVQDVTMSLPAGWKVIYAPPDLDDVAGGMGYRSHCKMKGARLSCRFELSVEHEQIAVADYEAAHRMIAERSDYRRHVILLQQK